MATEQPTQSKVSDAEFKDLESIAGELIPSLVHKTMGKIGYESKTAEDISAKLWDKFYEIRDKLEHSSQEDDNKDPKKYIARSLSNLTRDIISKHYDEKELNDYLRRQMQGDAENARNDARKFQDAEDLMSQFEETDPRVQKIISFINESGRTLGIGFTTDDYTEKLITLIDLVIHRKSVKASDEIIATLMEYKERLEENNVRTFLTDSNEIWYKGIMGHIRRLFESGIHSSVDIAAELSRENIPFKINSLQVMVSNLRKKAGMPPQRKRGYSTLVDELFADGFDSITQIQEELRKRNVRFTPSVVRMRFNKNIKKQKELSEVQ